MRLERPTLTRTLAQTIRRLGFRARLLTVIFAFVVLPALYRVGPILPGVDHHSRYPSLVCAERLARFAHPWFGRERSLDLAARVLSAGGGIQEIERLSGDSHTSMLLVKFHGDPTSYGMGIRPGGILFSGAVGLWVVRCLVIGSLAVAVTWIENAPRSRGPSRATTHSTSHSRRDSPHGTL